MARWHAFALATLGLVAVARTAVGQSPDAATLLREGVERRREGDDAGALELFRRASALRPSANAIAQCGLAEQALGRWDEAVRDLATALRGHGDRWVERNRRALEDALRVAEHHAGEPAAATASTAAAADGQDVVRTDAASAAGTRGGDGRGSASTRGRPMNALRVGALTTTVASAALLAVGATGWATHEGTVAAYNHDCGGLGGRCSPMMDTQAVQRSGTAEGVAIAGMAAGALAGIASAALWFAAQAPARTRAVAVCGVGAARSVIACRFVF